MLWDGILPAKQHVHSGVAGVIVFLVVVCSASCNEEVVVYIENRVESNQRETGWSLAKECQIWISSAVSHQGQQRLLA